MLRRGLIDFERIVPGFKSALQAAGAVDINFLMDTCGVCMLTSSTCLQKMLHIC